MKATGKSGFAPSDQQGAPYSPTHLNPETRSLIGLAAEHLIGLWQGLSNFQLSLGIDQRRIRSSIPERVEAGLRVFMVAYGPASVRQKKR